MDMSQFRTVVTVSTVIEMGCPVCNHWMGGDRFDESVQHMIEHGYVLLHVGSQTSENREGDLWHASVAILGSDRAPPTRSPLGSVVVSQNEDRED
jgi:hypothetical protein